MDRQALHNAGAEGKSLEAESVKVSRMFSFNLPVGRPDITMFGKLA